MGMMRVGNQLGGWGRRVEAGLGIIEACETRALHLTWEIKRHFNPARQIVKYGLV